MNQNERYEEHRSVAKGGNQQHLEGEAGRTKCGRSTSQMWKSELRETKNQCTRCRF